MNWSEVTKDPARPERKRRTSSEVRFNHHAKWWLEQYIVYRSPRSAPDLEVNKCYTCLLLSRARPAGSQKSIALSRIKMSFFNWIRDFRDRQVRKTRLRVQRWSRKSPWSNVSHHPDNHAQAKQNRTKRDRSVEADGPQGRFNIELPRPKRRRSTEAYGPRKRANIEPPQPMRGHKAKENGPKAQVNTEPPWPKQGHDTKINGPQAQVNTEPPRQQRNRST